MDRRSRSAGRLGVALDGAAQNVLRDRVGAIEGVEQHGRLGGSEHLGRRDALRAVREFDRHILRGVRAGTVSEDRPKRSAVAPPPYQFQGMTLEEVERKHIMQTMRALGGQKSRVAETLGINRTTLWKKLRQYEED